MVSRRHLPRRWCARLAVLVLLGSVAPAAARGASLSARAIDVLAKALTFATLPAGATRVAIVYAAGDSRSHADASRIATEIGAGFRINGLLLTPVVVSTAELPATRPAVIMTARDANGAAVARIARARHALCVTGDLAAVRAGLCMMSIRSRPRVEIVLNAAATRAAGIAFPTAFHMMVREL